MQPIPMTAHPSARVIQLTNAIYAVCDSLAEMEDQLSISLTTEITTLYRIAQAIEKENEP